MRYFVLPHEGLSDDLRAALTRGLGLSPLDVPTCTRHCERYDISDVPAFLEELEEAQVSLATARTLGAEIRVDWQGRLCYDLPDAPEKERADDAEGWRDDRWLVRLFGEATAS